MTTAALIIFVTLIFCLAYALLVVWYMHRQLKIYEELREASGRMEDHMARKIVRLAQENKKLNGALSREIWGDSMKD